MRVGNKKFASERARVFAEEKWKPCRRRRDFSRAKNFCSSPRSLKMRGAIGEFLQVGLVSREPQSLVGWFCLATGMSLLSLLVAIVLLALFLSALYIPLPYELCDRHKVQFFELLLRLSNEYLVSKEAKNS